MCVCVCVCVCVQNMASQRSWCFKMCHVNSFRLIPYTEKFYKCQAFSPPFFD